jgi:Fic family protein
MPVPAVLVAESRRPFVQTHPWIQCKLDTRPLGHQFWMLLGEARSKCRHLRYTPMKPSVAQELSLVYLAKGVHATTAIEGNTLTEEQAKQIIEGELQLPPSQQYLQREVDNVLTALQTLSDHLMETGGDLNLNVDLLKVFNKNILDGNENPDIVPGEIREHIVGVNRYRAPEADDAKWLLPLMCDWLNGEDFAAVPGDPRKTFLRAFCKAVVAHVYLAWIHPFTDGNGRVARLVEFGILTEAGLPTVAAHLLSNHYNQTRAAYYQQLEYASASGGDLTRFLNYALEGFVDQLQLAIDRVHSANLDVAWENFVHEQFRDQHTKTSKRQRDLILALSFSPGPVRRADLRGLTPSLAAAYAGSSQKMLTRDLNKLNELGLIIREDRGVRARTERMFDFMPDIATDGALD